GGSGWHDILVSWVIACAILPQQHKVDPRDSEVCMIKSTSDSNPVANSPTEESCFGTINASVSPRGAMELLSQEEIARLNGVRGTETYELFRRCVLAVLNCDDTTDDAAEIFNRYHDFDVQITQRPRGIKLLLKNAPACAFVGGGILTGVRDHLFAVLRDSVFVAGEGYGASHDYDPGGADSIDVKHSVDVDSTLVFHVLCNAGLLRPRVS